LANLLPKKNQKPKGVHNVKDFYINITMGGFAAGVRRLAIGGMRHGEEMGGL
jgi:hypothetical protein